MPTRPLQRCRRPGCPTRVRSGYCAEHDRSGTPPRAVTSSASALGYGGTWPATRRAYLLTHRVCEEPWCGRPARHVDHVLSKRDGGTDHPSNLMGLCASHHSAKTVAEDGGFGG